jgi:hypothetical protein
MKLLLLFFVTFSSLQAAYVFVGGSDVRSDSGETKVVANGLEYPLVHQVPMTGKQTHILVLSYENRSGSAFRLVSTLHPAVLDSGLPVIIPAIATGKKISEADVMAAIRNLVVNTDVDENMKFQFISCFSREINGRSHWEKFFSELFFQVGDRPIADSFIPMLCRNGVEFHKKIQLSPRLTDSMLVKIVRYSMYNDNTRHIYIEGLKRNSPEVNFITLDRLRGAADIPLVTAIKNLALSEEPRIQWAALMCLSTALERPIEAPSLADYIAEPQKFFDALAPILLKK